MTLGGDVAKAQKEVGLASGPPELTVPETLGQDSGGPGEPSPHSRLPSLQGSSSPNMAAGADEITTWSSGTCVTIGRGPSRSAGAATSTRAPSLGECFRGRHEEAEHIRPAVLTSG